MATTTNPKTGVEYYTDGSLEGQSVKLYVAVTDGQVRNPSGGRWPFLFGGWHDQAADYYELVPFTSVPYDPELFVVDSENSGWELHPARNAQGEVVAVPDGHPKGDYRYTETIKRRSVAELKLTANRYYELNMSQLWPQSPGYTEWREFAQKEYDKGNRSAEILDAINLHDQLISATRHNRARLLQLNAEIEAAGETGAVDFVVGQMATAEFPEGWVNGIPE